MSPTWVSNSLGQSVLAAVPSSLGLPLQFLVLFRFILGGMRRSGAGARLFPVLPGAQMGTQATSTLLSLFPFLAPRGSSCLLLRGHQAEGGAGVGHGG